MGLGEGYGTGQGEGTGEGLGSGSGSVGWSIFWLAVLLLVGFWFASLCAFLYIIFNMFAACIEGLTVSTVHNFTGTVLMYLGTVQ